MKLLLCAAFIAASFTSIAQVGIGTIEPDASSILDIVSTSKGLLMPRLTTTQRNAITSPATGLMIYNTTLNDGQLNNGTPSVPNWIGIKGQERLYSVTENGNINNRSTTSVLVPGMTVSPPSSTYLILFNAHQLHSSQTFSSDQAVIDAGTLYDQLMAYSGGVSHALTFGSGETLSPGIYDVAGAPSIAGTLTLDGGGDSNSVFIMRGTGAFTTAIGTKIVLTGNATPNNIFWVSNVAMSTATNTIMKGTMLGGGTAGGAMSLGAESNLEGSLLTKSGTITLGADVVLKAATGVAPVDLGVLSTLAMWSSSGEVSDVATASTTGDVGTALGTLTMSGAHTGEEYPAGTTSPANTTTYSIYQNGVEVLNSKRIYHRVTDAVNLQAVVTVAQDDVIEIRWKVGVGQVTLSQRILFRTKGSCFNI
jgi:hypothetical protein